QDLPQQSGLNLARCTWRYQQPPQTKKRLRSAIKPTKLVSLRSEAGSTAGIAAGGRDQPGKCAGHQLGPGDEDHGIVPIGDPALQVSFARGWGARPSERSRASAGARYPRAGAESLVGRDPNV